MTNIRNIYIFSIIFIGVSLFVSKSGFSQNDGISPAVSANEKLTLVEACMCETVKNLYPQQKAIVFPISTGSVACFTAFDPVPEKLMIYHKWYKRDRLITCQTLYLEPPRWRTYSKIHLREEDKAPWHVKIIGPKDKVIKILRFSVTD